jgi:glycosyltransferase involved in cell wall biosynthesis
MPQASILIIVENLPVPFDRRVWQEACALRDAGYEVVVICPQMRGYKIAEERLEGIQIYRHWISEEASGILGFVREYLSALWGETVLAWKAWRRHRFKLIHLCNPPDLIFLVAWPFKLLGVKIIYDVHDVWPEMFQAKFGKRGLLYWGIRAAERMTYLCANVVLATNESVKSIAINRGRTAQDRVFVVRTAPNIKHTDIPQDIRLKKGRPLLVAYVGVMGNADGVRYILEAAHHLIHRQGRRDIQFLLMGAGPEYDRLKSTSKELDLEPYVDMPGRVSNEFLFTALTTMDLGVCSDPRNEYNDHCTMNKTLEYMAFGKAQIMFDIKEGRASAGEAAWYVAENSAIKLAECLEQLLDDAPARAEMGRIGSARIRESLNWERSVEQLLKAYSVALKD